MYVCVFVVCVREHNICFGASNKYSSRFILLFGAWHSPLSLICLIAFIVKFYSMFFKFNLSMHCLVWKKNHLNAYVCARVCCYHRQWMRLFTNHNNVHYEQEYDFYRFHIIYIDIRNVSFSGKRELVVSIPKSLVICPFKQHTVAAYNC